MGGCAGCLAAALWRTALHCTALAASALPVGRTLVAGCSLPASAALSPFDSLSSPYDELTQSAGGVPIRADACASVASRAAAQLQQATISSRRISSVAVGPVRTRARAVRTRRTLTTRCDFVAARFMQHCT